MLEVRLDRRMKKAMFHNSVLEEASEAIVKQCIECRRCTKVCALIEHYGPTPKSLFKPYAHGQLIDPMIPYACHHCGRCTSVCPYTLPMEQVFMGIRQEYVKKSKGKSPIKGHGGVRLHQWLSFSSLFSYKKSIS